ncbi:MAG TPA: hypothetical protein VFT81_06885 [Dermatophilaceae bacterium]|nr:hypothetical protein [Dermatophilaceae bacterium]
MASPEPGTPSGAATGAGTGAHRTTTQGAPTTTTPPALPQLPRGGRELLPDYRLVGFAGAPGSAALGRLGVGALDDRAQEVARIGRAYADGRQVMPVLELIATVVQPRPGRDGKFRTRASDKVIAAHLAAARKAKGLLLLNIQPGRATFMEEARYYAKWLKEPDVGLALDPEWAMGPGEIPMEVFGQTTGGEIDEVAAYLAAIVKRHRLPEKALVFHQLAPSIVTDEKAIRAHEGVVVIKSVDGIGSRAMKTSTWTKLTKRLAPTVEPGFKLFYQEDRKYGPLMTPAQVLALRPQPAYILYE